MQYCYKVGGNPITSSKGKNHNVFFVAICSVLLTTLPNGINIIATPTILLTPDGFSDDIDPLVDLQITIDFLYIRDLEVNFHQNPPDFFLKLWLNGILFESPIWENTHQVYDPWTIMYDIPDTNETVSIMIELWNNQDGSPVLCDLSGTPNSGTIGYSIALFYNVKTGHWAGDDSLGDASGYGRANGCDDGSIYSVEYDCELGFMIRCNDYDGDGIPYWMELYDYGSDPTIDNSGQDSDSDNVPIEWEFLWGYNPFLFENHYTLDDDNDSLSNIEEYYTMSFLSDPFRRDLFLEMDYMDVSPNGVQSIVPEESREQLKDPFHRRNIVFHFDTGELNGGEIIAFQPLINIGEVKSLYNQYFLHNDSTTWRRGVFHYGIYVYSTKPNGYGFSGDVGPFMGYLPGTNSFIISSKQMEKNALWKGKSLEYYYAAATMHEMGHTMGIRNGHPPGCDMSSTKLPIQLGWWIYRTYKSIMNYEYTYRIFDYSDGSHGIRDFDDWSNLNLSHFEIPEKYVL